MRNILIIVCVLVLFQLSVSSKVQIVNGTTADEGEFPYMVELLDDLNNYLCGGSIIGKKWVLTAGHCIIEYDLIKTVVYGTNTLYNGAEPQQSVSVKKLHLHPMFQYNETDAGGIPLYDVGIVELHDELHYTDTVHPVQLVNNNEVPYHTDGVVTGWGVNETFGALQNLQKLTLQLLTGEECTEKIAARTGEDIFNPDHNLCSNDDLKGECYGDSGSPFVIQGIQYGVVSWSVKPCGSSPGTYSRIGNPLYREFITNVTGI